MNLSDYYKYSLFANLSYVLWDPATIGTQSDPRPRILEASRDKAVPEELADQIFRRDKWYIPTSNGFVPNDDGGFAANVFVRGNSNEKVLAIRGTEPDFSFTPLNLVPVDLWPADLYEIARYGLALHQAVSLINYVLLLKTPVGSQTDQFTLRIEDFLGTQQPPDNRKFFSAGKNFWLEATSRVTGLGLLSASDTITVTGHSLGGHLAALALRLFPGLFAQGVTFNAAGFDNSPLSLQLTDEFVGLFAQMLPQENPASTFASLQSKLFTAEAESARAGDDADFVPSWWTGADPTFDTTLIRTEVNSHSVDQF